MNTRVPGFQSFFCMLHHFVLAKLATSSIKFKMQNLKVGVGNPSKGCDM